MGRHAAPIPSVIYVPPSFSTLGFRWCLAANTRCTLRGLAGTWRGRRHRGLYRRNLRFRERGGSCVGRSRAGKTTKVMALADRDGLPLAVAIADGSRHDSVLTDRTLDAAFVAELPPRLIADKAWDGAALQKRLLEERGIELIAPKKRNSRRRQDGRPLRRYRRRWKVERLFAWLKRKRRLSVRWERKAENFLGMLQLGCATLLLRRIAR